MSEFSRETKPIGRGRGGGIYYKVWALVIMEAEKSHNLLSVSWRTRIVAGMIQPSPKAWELGPPMSKGRR